MSTDLNLRVWVCDACRGFAIRQATGQVSFHQHPPPGVRWIQEGAPRDHEIVCIGSWSLLNDAELEATVLAAYRLGGMDAIRPMRAIGEPHQTTFEISVNRPC